MFIPIPAGAGMAGERWKIRVRRDLEEIVVCGQVVSEEPMDLWMNWGEMPAFLAKADNVIVRYGDQITLFKMLEWE